MSISIVTTVERRIVTPPPTGQFWRVKHDIELAKGIWRPGMPEVHPLYDNHHSPFQKWAQLVSFELNNYLDKRRWTDFHHWRYWITNNNGFGNRDDRRANFVTGEYLKSPLPKVEALLLGGSFVKGTKRGDWVEIEGLHFNDPVTVDYLRAHPEYWVRAVYAGGRGIPYRMLGDKYEGPAFMHPLIVNKNKGPLVIEAYKLQPWLDPANPPDPLKIYL